MVPEIDLTQVARIYPSVYVQYEDGTKTTISMEWYEENNSSVQLLGYALILLYRNGEKKELFFDDKEEMFSHLNSLYQKLLELKK